MATTVASHVGAAAQVRPLPPLNEQAATIPWYIWSAALAVTSVMIGGHWDISWHNSIGRDTFWTPAHLAIHIGALLAGCSFGFQILHTTFARNSPLRESSVHIWGFRAPLGAFVATWGCIAHAHFRPL